MQAQPPPEFGQRIRHYRRQKGWSQAQAATEMGVQRTSLNRWEKGREMPCGANMTKLRDHLNMPIGSNEGPEAPDNGQVYQLLLPFEQPIDLELRVTPKRADAVQFEVRLIENRSA
jgi:transcriptional regulator with XRE-family HTH domain